jgi:hypothetical protein
VKAAALIDRYILAETTSESAEQYYQNLTKGINIRDLEEWEHAIDEAELTRLEDRSVMDILGTQGPTNAESVVHNDGVQANGSVADWIQIGIEIEEKQYVLIIGPRISTLSVPSGLIFRTVYEDCPPNLLKRTVKRWIGCDSYS